MKKKKGSAWDDTWEDIKQVGSDIVEAPLNLVEKAADTALDVVDRAGDTVEKAADTVAYTVPKVQSATGALTGGLTGSAASEAVVESSGWWIAGAGILALIILGAVAYLVAGGK